MQGSSRVAAAAVQDSFQSVLDGSGDRARLAEDLFGITGALDANIALRRAVADPSRGAEGKAALVERLFNGKVSPEAVVVTKKAASERWSQERDLTDTLESLAVTAVVADAERSNQADQLEDELFRFDEGPGTENPADLHQVFDVDPRSRLRVAMLRLGPNINVELMEYQAPDQRREMPRNSDVDAPHLGISA